MELIIDVSSEWTLDKSPYVRLYWASTMLLPEKFQYSPLANSLFFFIINIAYHINSLSIFLNVQPILLPAINPVLSLYNAYYNNVIQ